MTLEGPEISERGFQHFPPIVGTHSDTTIKVYESSAAERAALWVCVEGEVWKYNPTKGHEWPSGERGEMTLHLTLDKALTLRDQLSYLIDNHYHGTSDTPPCPVCGSREPDCEEDCSLRIEQRERDTGESA